jgi:RNA polymerase sigma factor FliA
MSDVSVHTLKSEQDSQDDATQEAQAWIVWRNRQDQTAKEWLCQYYLPYARALAAKSYGRRIHDEFEFNEYLQYALVGMMEALHRFDPDRGVQFKTFCTPRINGAILDGLEKLSEKQQQIAFTKRVRSERLASLHMPDTKGYEQRMLNYLGDIGVGLAIGFILEGTGMVYQETAVTPDGAYTHLELEQLRVWIWSLVESLGAKEIEVIKCHYQKEQTFEEAAKAMHLTKGRISQIHKQALDKLKRMMKDTPMLSRSF